MSKPGDKGWLPRVVYLKSLARKRISAGALFFDERGRVLLVKRLYRKHWTIPGGSVDEFESPIAACEREVSEEIGLQKRPIALAGVEYARQAKENDEAIHFIFNGGKLSKREIARLQLQRDELSELRFFSLSEIDEVVKKGSSPRWKKIIAAGKAGTTVYVEGAKGGGA